MNATYLMMEDIEDALSSFERILSKLEELNCVNSQINTNLQLDSWKGLTHDKCLCTHELIVQYFEEIETLCTDLKKGIYELDKNADEFVEVSDFVMSLSDI